MHFIVILLLLAYVLSSAPRFVRQWRNTESDIKIETISPLRYFIQAGKFYAIDPIVKIWEALKPLKNWAINHPNSSGQIHGFIHPPIKKSTV
jgi:hypothetical protein